MIADALRHSASAITYINEDELQAAIFALLDAGAEREARLSDRRSRIDILWTSNTTPTTTIGIEIKIDGSLADVTRQLNRYANCPEIDELILITTRAKHHHIPRHLGTRNIPVHLVSLIENGL